MKITWLGQAGLLFEIYGKKIVVDPYLSDSVEKINPLNYRRVPVAEEFLQIKPDVIVLTHNHLDHTDPETLKHYLGEGQEAGDLAETASVTVLASGNAWAEVRKFGGKHNYVCFNRHTQWTFTAADGSEIRLKAVKAEHSDSRAIGVVIEAEGKRYYVTGDTLYNAEILGDIREPIDVVFLPVNGVGNNMNMTDAKAFCEYMKPIVAVPVHCGLFDEIDMHDFGYEPKIVPEIYKEIKL